MKRSLFSMSLAALALCAGCANNYYASSSADNSRAPSQATVTTTATGTLTAGLAPSTVCQDGSVLPPNSACALLGGVDRQSTYSAAFEHYY